MDGKQRRVRAVDRKRCDFILSTAFCAVKITGIAFLMFTALARSAEEPLDLEFLEWLGQLAEVEEFGVDIEQLLLSKEQASEDGGAEAKSQ
ncbi:MAG: hypothetical protein ACI9UN_001926 [Granulosicoccus sp.]|jgi:hypothetical protein